MPELPEVETLKRELKRVLIGKKIKQFESEKFKLNLAGKKITGLERRAKILIFDLVLHEDCPREHLLVHLKMTGQLIYLPPKNSKAKPIVGGHPEDPTKYTRATFHFTDGAKLLFNDLRKFGWLRLAPQQDLGQLFSKTGVEPLSKQFTYETFNSLIARYPNRPLKQLLLDQTLIAGLGNIYVDEACFLARVLPTRQAGSLTKREKLLLHGAIISVLKHSIKRKGTSFRNYRRSGGEVGGFVPHLNVYGRSKEVCKTCGEPISKIKWRGRGTHFCKNCQR